MRAGCDKLFSMTLDPRVATAFARANGFALEPHLLVLALVGSHSHGTYIPPEEPDALDDVDLMGIVVPPLEYHLGLKEFDHWVFQFEELDVVVYSLRKTVRLLLKGNPNVVGLLWLRDQEYLYRHPLFAEVRASRSIFQSRAVGTAFTGYAYDQLKRMQSFDPQRMAEFEALVAEIEVRGSVDELMGATPETVQRLAKTWDVPVEKLNRFRELRRAHFSGFLGEKRKRMVRKFGYDVKNAAHLVRLLRMGAEYLESGELQVYRTTDAEELKAIKRGEWLLDQVKVEAERLFREVKGALADSNLPPAPDTNAAGQLLLRVQRKMLGIPETAAGTG